MLVDYLHNNANTLNSKLNKKILQFNNIYKIFFHHPENIKKVFSHFKIIEDKYKLEETNDIQHIWSNNNIFIYDIINYLYHNNVVLTCKYKNLSSILHFINNKFIQEFVNNNNLIITYNYNNIYKYNIIFNRFFISCYNGNIQNIKLLLKNFPNIINDYDYKVYNGFLIACSKAHLLIVEYFLKTIPNIIHDYNSNNGFLIACFKGCNSYSYILYIFIKFNIY